MSASNPFDSPENFADHLRELRVKRMTTKAELREQVTRRSLSPAQREQVLAKTAGMCHLCGGEIEGSWHADHVSSHSRGGSHEIANYLAAHQTCNRSRKGFDPEEMQWILKLGVWLKTQIETHSPIGQQAAEAFCTYERSRASRQVQPKP